MYNKKVLSKATAGLDKAKAPAKKKDIIVDPMGQWKHPGQNTRIPSSNITMQGVNYPVLGVGSNGQQQMMYPGMEYTFPGADYVDEFPQMQEGGIPYNYNQYVSNEPEVQGATKPFIPKRTKNEPKDYDQFLKYSESAPENRRPDENYFYGDPDNYDHYGMWDTLGKPKNFQEALQMNPDWQPDPYDGYYHGFSVNGNTGVFLKSGKPGMKPGDTTWMEIAGHYVSPRAQQDTPVYDEELERFKYVPNDYIEADLTDDEIEEYRKGGYTVEDISVPELTKAQKGKNVSLTTSPFSLNANAIPLASKVFGEYNPELLLGAKQTLKSPNQDYKHNATVDLGLPYTGKFAPSVNAAYHGAYDLSTPGQKLKPTVNSDLQVGYHPKQGVNFAVTANPRLEFSNVGQDTLNRKNWSQGAWKGYVGLLGSVGYRGKSFDPNNIQGVPASWATVDPKGGNFLMGFGANAGFEARPFKKPLKLGIDASLMESHGKKSAEQTVDSSPHNYTGWTPTVNVHASYPLSELMRKKQNKTREPNLPKNRPSGVHKFQEGGKLGPIHLNEGRKTLRDYVYGADIGMLQEQQGGYIDAELTDEEIQVYKDAGYNVEELD